MANPSYVIPPPVRAGDRVAVLSPSGPPVPERLEQGLIALKEWGVEPVVLESARSESAPPFDYLAGDDALRARDLEHALTENAYAAVLLARGGYGAQRALELVDWSAIAKAAPKPRHVVGFSDATAVLKGVARHLGWASMYGPMVATWYFAQDTAQEGLRRQLMEPDTVRGLDFPDGHTIVDGVAEGVLMGGCATLVSSCIGTDTDVPARDSILFLEDVGEPSYRLDRCLTQLRRSGYLDGIRAVLLGTFEDCGPAEDVRALLADRFGDLGVPVLAGADIGHGVALQTLPIGRRARLDVSARRLDLL